MIFVYLLILIVCCVVVGVGVSHYDRFLRPLKVYGVLNVDYVDSGKDGVSGNFAASIDVEMPMKEILKQKYLILLVNPPEDLRKLNVSYDGDTN